MTRSLDAETKTNKALVLVVDDQQADRVLARRLLEQAGFAVEEAADGFQALAAIERLQPDLVVLDVLMPEMDGIAVCEAIRARPETEDLPILIMTGLLDERSITRTLEAGATDFTLKPLKRPELTHRVHSGLRSRETKQKIRRLASYDSLTGLSNRESFQRHLARAVALAKRHKRYLAVLLLDLDDFKHINDTLGHNEGDLLLKTAAERILNVVRKSDTVARCANDDTQTVVARLGGDEFVVLLPEIEDGEYAAAVAARIMTTLSRPFTLANNEVVVTASIGISVFPDDAQDGEILLKNVDSAMYCAKRAGKNIYQFYDRSTDESALRRFELAGQLRRALERDEFTLHYQPQMELASGRISGVETLLRWCNEKLGAVSPAEFIPLAERNGSIIEIGKWTLRTACLQAKAWQDQGIPLGRMAVNISVLQFAQSDFVEQIAKVLNDTGLEAHALELEITESLIMKNIEQTIGTLKSLKALGVQLAIDDFGTGYSSLNYLKRFPIDRLKIDQSFVREITSDPDDAAIAAAITAMAKSMHLDVIAEGVETYAQLAFLKKQGCQAIQGYYISRPLPAPEIGEMLERNLGSDAVGFDEPAGRRTVLFVDDEARIIAAIKRILKNEDYRILGATDAAEAFELLAKHEVGVVVSDYRMPRMNGNEFLRRVTTLCPNTVRIMLSGQSDMKSVIEAINEGVVYKFLEKPVSADVLRSTLHEAYLCHERLKQPAHADASFAPLPSEFIERSYTI